MLVGAFQDCEIILPTLLFIYPQVDCLGWFIVLVITTLKKERRIWNPSYEDNQGVGDQLVDMAVHICGLFMANAFGWLFWKRFDRIVWFAYCFPLNFPHHNCLSLLSGISLGLVVCLVVWPVRFWAFRLIHQFSLTFSFMCVSSMTISLELALILFETAFSMCIMIIW